MAFGPRDGYLYIDTGDGGPPGDPDSRAQDPSTLLGKMLRIDVESGVKPYSIPVDNPYVQTQGYREEIWALGLRNPWGFSFDNLTGDLSATWANCNTKRSTINLPPAPAAKTTAGASWRAFIAIRPTPVVRRA